MGLAFFSTTSFFAGKPWPTRPFVFRMVLLDIPNTVLSAIKSLPAHCVAVTIGSDLCIPHYGPMIIRAARRQGMHVIWNDFYRKRTLAELKVMLATKEIGEGS